MRFATTEDIPLIEETLLAMLAKSPARQMKFADQGAAFAYIRQAVNVGNAYIEDGYFILVDAGRPWYSYKEYLIEELILKIRPTTQPVTVAIKALSEIARSRGFEVVAAGDTQVGYMTPHYIAEGFTTIGTQLLKEIDNGIRPQDHRGAVAD